MTTGVVRAWLRSAGLVAVLLVAGCAAERPKPAELQALQPKIAGRQVWSAQVGSGVAFPLQIAVRGQRAVVAGDDGTVLALDVASGQEQWRTHVGEKLSAGVGSDGRFDAVVTQNNQLVVLDNGVERWRAPLPSRVVTAPLVAGERVFVLGVDRVVHALDALDGRRLWTLKRPGDALLLAQSGVLAAWQNTLLVGIGARLVAVDPTQGSVRWDVALTAPRGSNEVERLADLVGPVARSGNSYCMRAFQNAVGCINAERASLSWASNGGGIQGIGGDADLLVGADGSDRITARRRAAGELAWTSELLLNRQLSAPAVVGPTVVFGDFEGQVHFLSKDSGAPLLRLPTDGSRVIAQPVAAGTTLLVATARGGLFAFRPE